MNLAYPNAEIAVMGADGAVNIIFRGELKNAEDAEAAKRKELVDDYRWRFATPFKRGRARLHRRSDQPIADAHARIAQALAMLAHKTRHQPAEEARQHSAIG